MKKYLKVILILVIGFVGGVITTCYLSMRAGEALIDTIRIEYELEQELRAIRAKKQGDMNQAIKHYENLVAASSSPGLYCFSRARERWSMGFPFASIMLWRTFDPLPEKGNKTHEAFKRAVLADALEKSGRIEEANAEYSKAARLFGWGNDIFRVKEAGRAYIQTEDTTLEDLQDRYIYPEK